MFWQHLTGGAAPQAIDIQAAAAAAICGPLHSCAEHFKHFFSIMLNSENLSQLTSLVADVVAERRNRGRNIKAPLDEAGVVRGQEFSQVHLWRNFRF